MIQVYRLAGPSALGEDLEGGHRIGRAVHDSWEFINRHVAGDWCDVDAEDRKENEYSLVHGFRLSLTVERFDCS